MAVKNDRMLTAKTPQRVTFTTKNIPHIFALVLLYPSVPITRFRILTRSGPFSQSLSHIWIRISDTDNLYQMLGEGGGGGGCRATGNTPGKGPAYIHTNTHTQYIYTHTTQHYFRPAVHPRITPNLQTVIIKILALTLNVRRSTS